MDARDLLWRTVPPCFVLYVWLRYAEILVGLVYLPLKQNKFYSQSLNVWLENHNTHKYEACTFEIWWRKVLQQLEKSQQAFGQKFHWRTNHHISSTNDCLGCCLDHYTTVQTGCCLTWMSSLWGLSLPVQRHDNHMVINPGCIYLFIDWLISIWVWALMVPMHLGLINGPFVFHNLVSAQGSPVPC